MLVSEIVRRVRSAVDELMVNDAEFAVLSDDTANLVQVIKDKIGYALQYVVEHAPLEKLDGSMIEELTPAEASHFSIDGTSLVGVLKMPSDLLRIVEARLSSWSQFPKPENDSSQLYLMQHDEYARGSWDRPVNILTLRGGDRYLEMYSARSVSDTLNFSFVRKPVVAAATVEAPDPDVGVPGQLEAAFIYQLAGLSMIAFREEVAASLFTIAHRYMESALRANEE